MQLKGNIAHLGFLVFLLLWVGLNLVQAGAVILDPDEAYYWMYSRKPAWGYFDHPPALAILINLGYSLFPSELGVRIPSVFLQAFTFVVIWLLAGKPRWGWRLLTLVGLLVAMPMFEVYGFIAAPDAPLLFFTALFFWLYDRYLRFNRWTDAALLGACMALLLYSKYHGVLVIGFTLLSNLALLRRPSFYFATLFGALLFFPHLYWQYAHDFPSIRYHLVGRDDPYELKHTLNYLLNQLLIFNPFIMFFTVQALWRRKWGQDGLERAFYFVIVGFWVFFLLTTLKGHTEPQWTSVLTIPLLILTYRYSEGKPRVERWLRGLSLFSLILFLILRVFLIFDIRDASKLIHRDDWVFDIGEMAGNTPVIFENSYRHASLYNFYLDAPAYTFTNIDYRKNQFDIWDWEKRLHNQRVLFVGQPTWECSDCQVHELSGRKVMIKFADSLQVAQKFVIQVSGEEFQWRAGDQITLKITVSNPYDHTVFLDKGTMPVSFEAVFASGFSPFVEVPLLVTIPGRAIPPGTSGELPVRMTIPQTLDGDYQMVLGVAIGDLPPSINSRPVEVRVVER